jgi:hypothetical protein
MTESQGQKSPSFFGPLPIVGQFLGVDEGDVQGGGDLGQVPGADDGGGGHLLAHLAKYQDRFFIQNQAVPRSLRSLGKGSSIRRPPRSYLRTQPRIVVRLMRVRPEWGISQERSPFSPSSRSRSPRERRAPSTKSLIIFSGMNGFTGKNILMFHRVVK